MSTKTFAQFVQKDEASIKAEDFLVGYRPTNIDKTGEIRININDLETYIYNKIKDSFSLIPTGTIMPYAGRIDADHPVPSDWLLCDGKDYDRNDARYKDLYNVIKVIYGNKNNSTFKVPDLRGLFIRGFGGTSPNISGQLGTVQEDQFQGHKHSASTSANENKDTGSPHNIPYGIAGTAERVYFSSSTVTVGDASNDGANGTPRTGKETRPANMAMNYIIKL